MARIESLPGTPWVPRWSIWLVLLIGVALAGVGGYLWSLDGSGTCNVPNVTCPYEYATGRIGMLLVVAACIPTGLALWLGRRSSRRGSAPTGTRLDARVARSGD